ncbi:MAG: DnaB-like helicase C-terminal domain-containing protein [Gemmatimonadaceae bacterium]
MASTRRPTILQDAPQNTPHEVSFPWYTVSEMVDTMRPGSLVMIAGDTGMGKTTLVESMLMHFGKHGVPACDAATEITGDEMQSRLAARLLGFDIADVLRKRWLFIGLAHGITATQAEDRMHRARAKLARQLGGVGFYDNPRPTIEDIEGSINRFGDLKGNRLGVYFVDHVLQMQLRFGLSPDGILEAVARIQAACAANNAVPVLPLQYNRAGRTAMMRLDPQNLAWLHGSDSLGQMGGTILFMTRPVRPEYEKPAAMAEMLEKLHAHELKYRDVVIADQLVLTCMKSRDLGERNGEQVFLGRKSFATRGAGAKRTLFFRDGFYRSHAWVEANAVRPEIAWDDAAVLPAQARILTADPEQGCVTFTLPSGLAP